jgi:hypothetical protein
LMGPTSLLVTSVVLLLFLVTTDFVRVHNTTHAAGDVDELQARCEGRLATIPTGFSSEQEELCSAPRRSQQGPAVRAGLACRQKRGERACISGWRN